MQWEYLFVDCERHRGRFRPRYINGTELPNWEKTRVSTFANEKGKEGWELVNDAATPETSHTKATYGLTFKRPLSTP